MDLDFTAPNVNLRKLLKMTIDFVNRSSRAA